MIQIYSPTNTDYTHNGDQTLFPSAATLHAILNGSWTAELTHPIDADGRWKSIVKDAVVKMPSFNGEQLFRIKSTSKSDSGVTAAMEPIFMDSTGDCFLVDIRPTAKNGQQALNDMVSPNGKYSASSDITRAATAYYEYKNLIEAIAGDDDNAFLKRWGGEILYDNFTVIVNERVGGDYGVEVRYGKNIPQDGVTEEVDTSAIITRIYPKAYNGYTMTNHGHVDSPLINSYPTIKAATLTFDDVKMATDAQEDDAENGVIICNSQAELDQALTQRCQEQYDSGLDKPTVSLDISMVLLQNTEQYKDYQILETVSLGDTIHCRDSHLDITSDARAIELEYDSIQKRVSSVVIGEAQYNYFDKVTDSTNRIEQVIRPNGTLMAERVQGILNGIYTQLRLQSTAAQKVNGSAFLVEDTDPESALYGAMVWGTQGLQLSVVRTADGRSWDWTTAVTAKGIVADAIVTGILSDKEGKNYWNLDTGEFRLSAESFLVDDETVQNYVDGAIDDKIAQIRELTVQLSNEVTLVPTSADGSGGNYSEAYTDVSVYLGTSDVSAAAQITVAVSAGVTGSWNPLQRRYSVTYLESDVGAVTFTVTYSGLQMSKTFTVAKSKQGQSGENGTPGPAGQDGKTSYFHVKYSSNPDGNPMTETPNTYIGTYVDFTQADSTDPSDYTWARLEGMQGEQGIPGTNGENGQTSYLHIKYSNDGGNSFTPNNGETPGDYIGQYVDFTQADSTDPKRYSWSLTKGEAGVVYSLQADTLVIKQGADNAYNPPSITFSAFVRVGDSADRSAYSGRFVISESTNGTTYVTKYTSSANETSHTYTPSAANVKNIRCILYASGGTTNALDMQGVAIVRDIDNLTQEDVFNILTNNGVVQGIYLQNGQLYINAEYIATGRLASVDGSSYWDLNTGELNIDGKLVFDDNQLTVNGNVNVPSGGHINVANGGAVNIDNIVNGRYHRVTVGSGGVVVNDYGTNTPEDDTQPAQVANMGVNTSQPVGLVRSVRYSQSSAGVPQAIQDFTNIIGGTIQSSNGSRQSTMTPAGITTGVLSASSANIDDTVSCNGIDSSGPIYSDGIIYAPNIELSYSTPYIDFHAAKSTSDFTSRIMASRAGYLAIGGGGQWGFVAVDATGGHLKPEQEGNYSLGSNGNRFAKLWVTSGVDNSSLAELKTDIKPFSSGLEELNNTDVYNYKLKSAIEKNGDDIIRTGFVIGKGYKTSRFLLGERGDGIELYNAVGVVFEAAKEMYEILKQQEEEIKLLKSKTE